MPDSSRFRTLTLTGFYLLTFCLWCCTGALFCHGKSAQLLTEDGCFQGPEGFVKDKNLFILFLYLGFGTLSSGTAVQTESGVFCSLKRPLNTFSMSSMLNAQTAEPGMLEKGKTIRKTIKGQRAHPGPTGKHRTSSHLLS